MTFSAGQNTLTNHSKPVFRLEFFVFDYFTLRPKLAKFVEDMFKSS